MRRRKKTSPITLFFRGALFVCLGLSIAIILVDAWVEYNAKGRTYDTVDLIPRNSVGLLLGTSKYSITGQNLFYKGRIDAAVELYNSGKVEYILISGDNSTKYYNEPKTFKQDLIKRGIPANRIVLDYAGFRTLDSVVRAKEVFQQDKITVISQQFHNERALFIASFRGIEAIGFNAKDIGGERGFGIKVRERLARMKMIWDILSNKQPKFLGEPIKIGQ
ncbi:MAG: DUF218 domain-containing protein [Flavobacteriales bacterium]|nr:DUF218 domain-containing protein [Flavobacteriales bacterium]